MRARRRAPGRLLGAKLLPSASSRLFTITHLDGSAVTLTDAGTGIIQVLVDAGPMIDAIMAAETSFVVARAHAYKGPWEVPPGWAPMLVGDLGAYRVAKLLRVSSPQYSMEALAEFRTQALTTLGYLAKGEPMSDGVGPIDASPNVAEAGATSVAITPGPFGSPQRLASRTIANLTPGDGWPPCGDFGEGDRV